MNICICIIIIIIIVVVVVVCINVHCSALCCQLHEWLEHIFGGDEARSEMRCVEV